MWLKRWNFNHLKTKIISLYERLDLKDEEISRLTAANQELLAAAPEAEDEVSVDAIDVAPEEPEAAPEPEAPAGIVQRLKFLLTGKI